MNIIIYCSTIINNDAIGNDILIQYDIFKKRGIAANLFAYHGDHKTKPLFLSEHDFIQSIKMPKTILIVHYGALWDQLLTHLELSKCYIIFKYHNITPGYFFDKYNSHMKNELNRSRDLLQSIVCSKKINHYWADSNYNKNELLLLDISEDQISVIPPFHKVADFAVNNANKHNKTANLIFVGRIAPNKGHIHLIEIIKHYKQNYGQNIQLNIIGSIQCELQPYYKTLKNLIKKYHLDEMVHFCSHVSFEELKKFYQTADIFLLMSEHEGFCVPILEAQYNRVPILALDRTATKETLGANQLIYDEINYDLFASAIQVILNNNDVRDYLITNGLKNYQSFTNERTEAKIFENMLNITSLLC